LPSALISLAAHLADSENEGDKKRAIDYYERYARLEPYDPRPHVALAAMFEEGDPARAEAEYRAALKLDPRNLNSYISLAAILAASNRHGDALAAIKEAEQRTKANDLIASLFINLFLSQKDEAIEKLAASEPEQMAKSADANLYLAFSRDRAGRTQDAIAALKRAIAIKPDYGDAYGFLSECYRKLRNYREALVAADAAIKIDEEDPEAHFERACSLARLGRRQEALAALKRAIEYDEDYADEIAEEEDLKPLRTMVEFKKLLPKEGR
jgi:tetratricopeptide (TPR) repeat protein